MDNDSANILAGQLRSMLDFCAAMAIVHPRPQEVLPIFDKLHAQAVAQARASQLPASYIGGLTNFSVQVRNALVPALQVDALQATPPQDGH
jgi:hypothetical protein